MLQAADESAVDRDELPADDGDRSVVLELEGTELAEGFRNHDRIVAGREAEVGGWVRHARAVARHRQQRRVMIPAQLRRKVVDREADVSVRKRDAVELRAA